MNLAQIEDNLQKLLKSFNKTTFIYDLLLSYGIPKNTITRLQKGGLNLSKAEGEIDLKKKLFYKISVNEDLHELIDDLNKADKILKHNPRFLIVTDFNTLLAIDRKTSETLDIPILEIAKHFDFFLPWAGMEKAQLKGENPADVKAAEKMAKLYNEIRKTNILKSPEEIHNLNVFLSRLLFCFFAEDTGIFEKGLFTSSINSHTQKDGSDLNVYLEKLFTVMNTELSKRGKLPAYLEVFPYVNGGLYKNRHTSPIFTETSRKIILECGTLNWSAINPDIFGSMIQAVVRNSKEDDNTKHYTSVPNIMKVIEPLFLNDLYEEFNSSKYEPKRLNKLLERISKIKIFDPACGSGNFLIIAYKELRLLEIKILQQLQSLQEAVTGFENSQFELIPKTQLHLASSYQPTLFTRIELSQFYGIELDDFAHEIAILSLWLAQHQMNMKFREVFGTANPTLPLQAGGNIVHGNATRVNWERVCPKKNDDEIYILGNPPYSGSRKQDVLQKKDLEFLFGTEYKSLDYIASWFYMGANYIRGTNSKCAFVSTNSICQGGQVSITWQRIIKNGIEICFAHKDFKWTNNAKHNAGVTVVIIGLSGFPISNKFLYYNNVKKKVKEINAYLVEGPTLYIHSNQNSISGFPEMNFGNMPADGGKLLFNTEQKDAFINLEPGAKKYFQKLVSADEFLNGKDRWCLWLEECNKKEIESLPLVKNVVAELKEIRNNSSRPHLAKIPHLFAQITQPKEKNYILIPRHSSENRQYIPIGFFDSKYKAHDSCLIIPTDEIYLFGILTSKIHMLWVHSVCGRLETRYRYSKDIVYNNFPFPKISNAKKDEISNYVYIVLEERERYSEKTLAQLYDCDKMPQDLRKAHQQLDLSVERCYRSKPFENDEERLEHLFKLYAQMIVEEKDRNAELNFDPIKNKKKKIKYA